MLHGKSFHIIRLEYLGHFNKDSGSSLKLTPLKDRFSIKPSWPYSDAVVPVVDPPGSTEKPVVIGVLKKYLLLHILIS